MNKMLLNFNAVMFGKITKVLLILTSTILISRYFGPEGKGIFVLMTTLPILTMNFGNLGMNNSNTYFVAKDINNTKILFYNSCWLGLVMSLIFIFAGLIIWKLNASVFFGSLDTIFILMILIIIPFVLIESFFQGILIGQKKFIIFNIGQILPYILIVANLIIGRRSGYLNIFSTAIITTIALIIPAILYFLVLASQFGIKLVSDLAWIKKSLNFGFRSYLVASMSYLILRSDIYLVNIFLDVKNVGLYSLAVNFADALLLISNALIVVLFPYVVNNIENGLKIILKTSKILSLIILVILLLIVLMAKPIVTLVFGTAFLPALSAVYILLFASWLWSLVIILSLYFAVKEYPWSTIWIWLPGLLINLTINYIFLPKIGFMAAAWSSLIAYATTLGLHIYYLKKQNHLTLKSIMIPQKEEFATSLKLLKNLLNSKNE